MKKLMLILVFALCGCADEWEYRATLPLGTTMQETMQIESMLKSNGYVRVRFVTRYELAPVAVSVYATRKE